MATRRKATILLLLLMSVASSIELETVAAVGESIVDSGRAALGDLGLDADGAPLIRATGRSILGDLPKLCTIVTPITEDFQILYNGARDAAGGLGIETLLDDVCLQQGAYLVRVKNDVTNLPSQILSGSGLPVSLTDGLLGTTARLTSDVTGFPGFTISTLDGTLDGAVVRPLDRTLDGALDGAFLRRGLSGLPGITIVGDVTSDVKGLVYIAGNRILAPVEAGKAQVESAVDTVVDLPTEIL